uniref:C2H2-type domain-containing protein n=1 Tax=Parascaris equorum TaxID=6256 RepID=A0A914R8L4_PAREQ
MEGEEAIGLEEMKHRIQQIEQERLFEAELQKYQADQEKLDPHPAINNAGMRKKSLIDVEFLKTITLESAVGYVEPSVLEIYKAKCHLCEDRLTDPKYMIIHEKIRHPMMFFCHYEPTISVSLDAAPTLPVQRAASAQSKVISLLVVAVEPWIGYVTLDPLFE